MHFAWFTWPCKMERGTGLEPATICLEGRDSTTELPPLIPAYRTKRGAWDRD
jgi:hypothetical protein